MTNEILSRNLDAHLKRFYKQDQERLKLAIELSNQGVSSAEIFRQVSSGLGINTHVSGKSIDKMKDS